MFITRDHYKHPLSGLLSENHSSVWQIVDVELQMPWFIVELNMADEEGLEYVRTMLLSLSHDVLDLVQQCGTPLPRVKSVSIMSPDARPGGWAMHPLVAIWEASEPNNHEWKVHLFEKADGTFQTDSRYDTTVDQFHGARRIAEFPSHPGQKMM